MFSQVSVIPFGGGVEGGVSSDDYQASPAGGGYVHGVGMYGGRGMPMGMFRGEGWVSCHVCVCVCVCARPPTHQTHGGVKLLKIE